MIRKIVIFMFVTFIISGCASEITDKTIKVGGSDIVPQVKELEIGVSFRSNYSANNKIYFIFSPTENINVLGPDYYLNSFFLVPGKSYSNEQQLRDTYYAGDTEKDLQDIYDDFFSSWDDLLLFDGNFFSLNSGPFVSANQHLDYTPDNLNLQYQVDQSTLIFTIDISRITTVNNIYFKVLTVDENDQLKDYTENSCFIEVLDNQTNSEPDFEDYDIEGSLDIISWEARVDIY